MTRHEDNCIKNIQRLRRIKKEFKWYEFIAQFTIWLDIRENKKQIRWVRRLNGDYHRKIEVTK